MGSAEASKIRRAKRVGFLTLGRPPSLSSCPDLAIGPALRVILLDMLPSPPLVVLLLVGGVAAQEATGDAEPASREEGVFTSTSFQWRLF